MSGFQRTHDSLPNSRGDGTRPRFHIAAVQDEAASAAASAPIFRDEERVQHLIPGSFNSHVERVNDSHRQRWPAEYAAFKGSTTMSETGTPLEQWPLMTPAMVAMFKAMNVHTVQQCAVLNDEVLSRTGGTGIRRIKDAAAAFLDDADAAKITTDALRRAELAEMRTAQVESQLVIQAKAIEQLQGQLLNLGNTLSGGQTYVPGQHDPVEQARQFAPPQVHHEAPVSALDTFQAPIRRGRPTNAERAAREGASA